MKETKITTGELPKSQGKYDGYSLLWKLLVASWISVFSDLSAQNHDVVFYFSILGFFLIYSFYPSFYANSNKFANICNCNNWISENVNISRFF